MKKTTVRLFAAFFIFTMGALLSACSRAADETPADWGSFTPDKTYSYDEKYYALQTVVEDDPEASARYIKVTVYLSDTDEAVAEFNPARARDFWGICWESDTYNIWTQSADIGIFCYAYQDGEWVRDEDAERPSDIISKYDDIISKHG